MTTVVTGAGLIGASFAQHAVRRGERVVFVDPLPRDSFLRSKLGDAPYEVIEEDVRNVGAMIDVLRSRKVETIVHTASRIGARAGNPIHEGFSLNIAGTQAMAEAARVSGVRRIIQISSLSAYDWRRAMPDPVDEDFPRGNGAPYGNFKAAQELILEAYRQVYGFELIILRPANVFGAGHFWAGSASGEKVQDLIVAGLEGKPAKVALQQTVPFEYVYAKDVGAAIDCAATCLVPRYTTFNIGTGVMTTFDTLVAIIKGKLPGLTSVEVGSGTPTAPRSQRLDLRRAREHLGWAPAYTLDTALDDYIAEVAALRASQ